MAKRESYLMIDHRSSPGVPAGFYRERGFNMPEVREGQLGEYAVLVCAHCQQHQIKNHARTRERASCVKCGGEYICDVCEWRARQPDYVHTPFKRIIDDTLEANFRTDKYSQAEPYLLELPRHLKERS